MWILFDERNARRGSIGVIVLTLAAFVFNLLMAWVMPSMAIPMYIVLTILLVAAVYFGVVLVRENPSTFTASVLATMLLYMATWVVGITGFTFTNPEFFIIQVLPLVVAASIFGSVRRPWRYTLSMFIVLLCCSLFVPIILVSFYAGEWMIWFVMLVEGFACICLVAPLNYFIEERG
jgi:hypothetical protein